MYDVAAKTKISANASAYGIGSVLLQQQNDKWRSVAFTSCSLSETECHYTHVEKEALALTRALEKFSEYVFGEVVHLETDHKPIIPLLGKNKPIIPLLGKKTSDLLPPRAEYNIMVGHQPFSDHSATMTG